MTLCLFEEILIPIAKRFGVTEERVLKLVHLQLVDKGVATEGQIHPHPLQLNLGHRYACCSMMHARVQLSEIQNLWLVIFELKHKFFLIS